MSVVQKIFLLSKDLVGKFLHQITLLIKVLLSRTKRGHHRKTTILSTLAKLVQTLQWKFLRTLFITLMTTFFNQVSLSVTPPALQIRSELYAGWKKNSSSCSLGSTIKSCLAVKLWMSSVALGRRFAWSAKRGPNSQQYLSLSLGSSSLVGSRQMDKEQERLKSSILRLISSKFYLSNCPSLGQASLPV